MLGNGTTEIPDVDPDDFTLKVRNHEAVKELRERLGEKREQLEKLRHNRRRASSRRSELEEKFEQALRAESDLDPSDVRKERLELEEEIDQFQERRTALQAEIASLEQRIDAATETAREEISEEVEEPLRQLHAAYAHHLQQALKAHLKLKEFAALGEAHQRVPGLPDGERHVERPDLPMDEPQVDGFPGIVGAVKQLRALRWDGFDIDNDLLNRLNDVVHA